MKPILKYSYTLRELEVESFCKKLGVRIKIESLNNKPIKKGVCNFIWDAILMAKFLKGL